MRPSRVRSANEENRSNGGATTRLSFSPSLEKSLLLKEVAPSSQNLSALGAAGLAALDYIDRGEAAPPEWVTHQTAVIEQAKKAQAQLLIIVAPAVEKLIQASARHATPSPAK